MHTPDCDDAIGLNWWPQGSPTEISVATLPAAGAITSPLRLEGTGPWVGVWGSFQGARIAYSPRESFMLQNGAVFRYPTRASPGLSVLRGVDMFLSGDTGATGTLGIGRFKSREAALMWVGTRASASGGTGAAGTAASVGKNTTINTAAGGSTTLHTVPVLKVFTSLYIDGFMSAFTAAATVQITINGNVIDQYVTSAVGSLFRARGPIYAAAGEVIAINVSVAAAGTLTAYTQALQTSV